MSAVTRSSRDATTSSEGEYPQPCGDLKVSARSGLNAAANILILLALSKFLPATDSTDRTYGTQADKSNTNPVFRHSER